MQRRIRSIVPILAAALAIPAQPATGSDPVLAAAGDIACSPGDPSFNGGAGTATHCRMAATSDLLLAMGDELSAVLTLGDLQYESGQLSAFQASFDPTWGRLGDLIHPVAGNHEYITANAADYYTYFGPSAGDPSKGYYSFDLETWHVIVLNSNCGSVGGCGPGSAQLDWLVADLAAHPADCVLAAWHHPRFSSGAHGNDATYAAFWEALYAARADVVLNGHDHLYERFAAQDPAARADAVRGLRQFIVGTGGKVLVSSATRRKNSEVLDDDHFGVLRLALRPGSYDWEFVPLAGGTLDDSGTGRCSRSREAFYTLQPCRLLDTRGPAGPYGGPALAASALRRVPIAGRCGIAADATAVALNFTVVSPASAGELEAWPAGSERLGSIHLGFRPGVTRAAASVLALGVDGAIDLSAVMPSGATDLVIDVSGFFGQYSSAAFGSTLLYAGAGAALFGAVAAVRPLPRLGLGRRRLGLLLLAAGVAMGVAAVLLPAPTRVSAASGSLLDAAMPEYQFREFHALRVEAPPERAWAAIRAVTADEIRLFRLLTWLRNPRLPGRSAPESILAPPAAKPILEVALGSGFFTLAEDAPRELVIGAYVVAPAAASRLSPAALRRATEPLVFTALDQPGFAKAAMNFRLLDLGGGASLLTTETRVVATDAATRRRFGAYWRAIYPGSALIRRMWLRAIRDRAALEPAA